MYWKAYILELQNKRREASRTYSQLLEQYPTFKNRNEVQLRKALCDYQEKEFPSAYREFLAVLRTETGAKLPADVIFWMVFFADENKKHDEALQIANRILALFDQPQIKERGLIAKGNQLVALKKWADARSNAEQFLKEFAESAFKPEIFWTLANAYQGEGNKDKALEFFEKSLLELQNLGNPDPAFEAALYMDRGRLLETMKQTGKALESYLRVAIIFDHPQLTPEALFCSIRCHLALGEKNEAQLMFTELSERYTDSPWYEQARQTYKDLVQKEG